MFLAQGLVLLGEESLTLQTVTAHLKWDKKRKITQLRCVIHTVHWSGSPTLTPCYAQMHSKNENEYLLS